MSTKIYCVVVSFMKMGEVKVILYIRSKVNFCWFCQTSVKFSKRSAYNAVEHL
jgi:hypothetical protein